MFGDNTNEQQLYHALATVGTLLLQIGEVGKQFYLKQPPSTPNSPKICGNNNKQKSPDGDNLDTDLPQPSKDTDTLDKETLQPTTDTVTLENAQKVSSAESAEPAECSNSKSCDSQESVQASHPCISAQGPSGAQGPRVSFRSTNSQVDTDWCITYKQFLASFLTESALSAYFEPKVDICPAIEKYRNRRLIERQASLSSGSSPAK